MVDNNQLHLESRWKNVLIATVQDGCPTEQVWLKLQGMEVQHALTQVAETIYVESNLVKSVVGLTVFG